MLGENRKSQRLLVWTFCATFGLLGCGGEDDQNQKVTSGGGKNATNGNSDVRQDEKDFFPLVLEEDFLVYPGEIAPDGTTWSSEGNVIKCSGDPRGYIYTDELYNDFTLRFDYRFDPAASPEAEKKLNTGVLVYIGEEHKTWPVSLEVQGKHLEMGTIKPNGGAAEVEISDDQPAREQARKPPGEWNSVEIVSSQGALTVHLNGVLICSSQPGELNEGAIGFQSEGVEVQFRDVRLNIFDPLAD